MGKWYTRRKRNHRVVRLSGGTEAAPKPAPACSRAMTDGTAECGAVDGAALTWPVLGVGERLEVLPWTHTDTTGPWFCCTAAPKTLACGLASESVKSEWCLPCRDVGKDSNELMVRGCLSRSSCYHWCLHPAPSRSFFPLPGSICGWAHWAGGPRHSLCPNLAAGSLNPWASLPSVPTTRCSYLRRRTHPAAGRRIWHQTSGL